MARIRTIKPEFWRDEGLAKVSPEACLLAIGLLNHSDDDGYFNANPKLVQIDVFPLRELSSNIPALLRELSDIGYVELFSGSDGKVYGRIPTFLKHQVINKKRPGKIKDLCEVRYEYGSDPVVLPTGMEGNGKERKKNIRSIDIDEDFEKFWGLFDKKVAKADAMKAWKQAKIQNGLVATVMDRARAYVESTPDKQYRKNPAAWIKQRRWEDELPTAQQPAKIADFFARAK